MNIVLWILQIILALHTIMGAIWKFSNAAQTLPSLSVIPLGVWRAMSVVEPLCSLGFVLPLLNRSLAPLVPIAALCIAAEMLVFCGLHLASGNADHGQMAYWIVVALICGFVAYGRLILSPL